MSLASVDRSWALGEAVSLRTAFGQALCETAARREDFVLLDADVASGTGAKPFLERFPERTIQFGIAEQNLMAAAAGLASTGLIPVVSTFAVFGVMRAHEQFRTAVAYPRRGVKLCCSHLGVDVGPDGATAQMLEDLAVMRSIPNVTVLVPADANAMLRAFPLTLETEGPVYMRIGRSPAPVIHDASVAFAVGTAIRMREGSDVTIVAAGVTIARALDAAERLAAEGISCEVLDAFSVKPLDEATILASAARTGGVVTAEDHSVIGGLGGAVAETLVRHHPVPVEMVGVADRFGRSGDPEKLAAHYGVDAAAIAAAVHRLLARGSRSGQPIRRYINE
ncbi:MAG TPA: transketolase C-terminal domain-containing protein [Solirubrobacteraceae bacterium]|nr:transketolase C-terminal domain-containing protein [Solirubrobacteraceae bacterium]